MNTREKIVQILGDKGELRPVDLLIELDVSKALLHRQLKRLLAEGKIVKKGMPPTVFYELANQPDVWTEIVTPRVEIAKPAHDFLESNYLYVTPDGRLIGGEEGFRVWAGRSRQRQEFTNLVDDYIRERMKINELIGSDGYLDARQKLEKTFERVNVERVFFSDVYALVRFGKTRLGAMVYYGKLTENLRLIKEVAAEIRPTLERIVETWKIDAIGFIPHSLPRKIPFLPVLREELSLAMPEVKLVKVYAGEIREAQKTLKSLDDRTENARSTIAIKSLPWVNPEDERRILLIDDAVGSGATLNEVAGKLKRAYGKVRVFGYSVVGSINGFEVIKGV
jgi:hypothetical protein